MPNGVIKDQDILIERLLNLDYDAECEKTKHFRDSHMEYGGNAAQKCIKFVFGKIE